MAKPDDLLISALHGTAMRRATEQGSMAEAVAELRDIAAGRMIFWPRLPGWPLASGP